MQFTDCLVQLPHRIGQQNGPEVAADAVLRPGGSALYTPTRLTLSPGLQESTKSSSRVTSALLGSCPAGAVSGSSCAGNQLRCWSSIFKQ